MKMIFGLFESGHFTQVLLYIVFLFPSIKDCQYSCLYFLLAPLRLQVNQGSHRLEKYLNFEGFLEKYLKIKSAF